MYALCTWHTDHSIFDGFSKVVQGLIPQLPTLENMLNALISVRTKIVLQASGSGGCSAVSRFLVFFNARARPARPRNVRE